jgi:hypothetical protein
LEIVFDFLHLCSPDSSPAELAKVQEATRKLLAYVNGGGPFWVHPNSLATCERQGRYVIFNFPNILEANSEHTDNAKVIRACLDYLVYVNRMYLARHPHTLPLYNSGVFYKRTQVWDSIPALYARGYGDCKSLASALVAQYLQNGIQAKPVHRSSPRGVGTLSDYHVLVQTLDGFEDPSKVLGMPHGVDF